MPPKDESLKVKKMIWVFSLVRVMIIQVKLYVNAIHLIHGDILLAICRYVAEHALIFRIRFCTQVAGLFPVKQSGYIHIHIRAQASASRFCVFFD